MNAKEAKNILKAFENGDYDGTPAVWEAKGYRAALEGKEVRALVQALEYYYDLDNGLNPPKLPKRTKIPVAYAALSRYHALTQDTEAIGGKG